MTKPYCPSNGTEGMLFMESWCDRCKRDAEMRRDPENGEGCPILAASMAYKIGEAGFPVEWVADDALGFNARCTAFELDPSA